MGLFKKTKKFDANVARGDLLRRLDALNDKMYKRRVVFPRDRFSEVRGKLQRAELDSDVYTELRELINNYAKMRIDETFNAELLYERMEKIMCFKKKQQPTYQATQSHEEVKFDEVQAKIDGTYSDIKQCENEIAALDKKIQYCLEHRLKTDWKMATTERCIKQNALLIKQNALATLLKLKGNMAANRTFKQMEDINQTVTSASALVNVEEMKEISENTVALAEQVQDDSAEIDEIVFGQSASNDDFDAAYEKYISETVINSLEVSKAKEKHKI